MKEAKIICDECKKEIIFDGIKCPKTGKKFHSKCASKHTSKCSVSHLRIRTWRKRQ